MSLDSGCLVLLRVRREDRVAAQYVLTALDCELATAATADPDFRVCFPPYLWEQSEDDDQATKPKHAHENVFYGL